MIEECKRMHYRFRLTVVAIVLLISSCASPQFSHPKLTSTVANPAVGYSFNVPEGWRVDRKEKQFTVRGGAQESLSDFNAPPNNFSFDLNVQTYQATALATGLCGKVISHHNAVNGTKWTGSYFVCSTYNEKTKQQVNQMFLTVKHRRDYFWFLLSAPAKNWPDNGDVYVAILRSLQFENP